MSYCMWLRRTENNDCFADELTSVADCFWCPLESPLQGTTTTASPWRGIRVASRSSLALLQHTVRCCGALLGDFQSRIHQIVRGRQLCYLRVHDVDCG